MKITGLSVIGLIIFLTFAFSLNAAGPPSIQALARIWKKTGEQVEGVVLIGKEGPGKHYDVNGFYLIESTSKPPGKRVYMFNLEFRVIEPYKMQLYYEDRNGQKNSTRVGGVFPESVKAYFLYEITSQKHLSGSTSVTESINEGDNPSELLMDREIVNKFSYKLLDYIPVFSEVPDDLHVDFDPSTVAVQSDRIPLSEVKKFELLTEPSGAWLKQISEKKKSWQKKMANCQDCYAPEWFHELVKRKDVYRKKLDALFNPWKY